MPDPKTAYEIAFATEADAPRWDQFVASHPLGQAPAMTHFKHIWKAHGWEPQPILALQNGAVVAGLHLCLKRTSYSPWPLTRIEVILPALGDLVDSTVELLKAAETFATSQGALGIQARCRVYDKFPINGVDYSGGVIESLRRLKFKELGKRQGTYVIGVGADDEALLGSLGKKCRRDIRKGLREGVKFVYLEGQDSLTRFGQVYREMCIRKQLLSHSYDLDLEELRQPFEQGCLRLFGAEVEGQIVNMALVDALGTARWRTGASTDTAVQPGAPPSGQVLQYGIMQWLRDHGVRYYDLGGSPGPEPIKEHPNYTVWRFKHEFGWPFIHLIPHYFRSLKSFGKMAALLAHHLKLMGE